MRIGEFAVKALSVLWAGGRARAKFKTRAEFRAWKKRTGKWAEVVKVTETDKPEGKMKKARIDEVLNLVKAAKSGAGSRGGKVSRHTKSGRAVYASADHKQAVQMSAHAYQRGENAYGVDGHAEAARAHLAAAYYSHHGGDKVAAREHFANAEHHYGEAQKVQADNKRVGGGLTYGGNKSYAMKWLGKNFEPTRKLLGIGKSSGAEEEDTTAKSMAKGEEMKLHEELESLFKSEIGDNDEPDIAAIEVEMPDGEVGLLPLEEIAKSLSKLRKGKKRRAKMVVNDNKGGGETKGGGGQVASSRPSSGIGGAVAPDKVSDAVKSEADKGKDGKGAEVKKGLEVIRHTGVVAMVANHTMTGDEAIAKAIESRGAGALGSGAIPSLRNPLMERNGQ